MCHIQWPVTGKNRCGALTGFTSTDFVLFLLGFILDYLSSFTFCFPSFVPFSSVSLRLHTVPCICPLSIIAL